MAFLLLHRRFRNPLDDLVDLSTQHGCRAQRNFKSVGRAFMLMAADPYTPKSGVALVVGMSVVANVVAYLIIGLVVWRVAAWNRRT